MSLQATETVLHMLTEAELEAVRRAAREDGAGLALAAVVRTLNAASKTCTTPVATQLLDLTIAAIGTQGHQIIRMIGDRKAP